MSKSLKKLVEESREKNQPEVDMSDRGISNMLDVNGLCEFPGRVFPWRSWKGFQVFRVTAGVVVGEVVMGCLPPLLVNVPCQDLDAESL